MRADLEEALPAHVANIGVRLAFGSAIYSWYYCVLLLFVAIYMTLPSIACYYSLLFITIYY